MSIQIYKAFFMLYLIKSNKNLINLSYNYIMKGDHA